MAELSQITVGDTVEMPPGADPVISTRYRILVTEINRLWVSGRKVKADGSYSFNRFREPVTTVIPTNMLAGAILHPALKECVHCRTAPGVGLCCSSHHLKLCHHCYRLTHFVEVCVEGCAACAAEGLPVKLSETRDGP